MQITYLYIHYLCNLLSMEMCVGSNETHLEVYSLKTQINYKHKYEIYLNITLCINWTAYGP
jgi:hypothetical protein